jgi:hypothetical protein
MPILYLLTCVQLFFTYWIDKWMLFKMCRLPEKIDNKISQIVLNTLLFMVLVKIVIDIWILGSPYIFYQTMQWDSIKELTQ